MLTTEKYDFRNRRALITGGSRGLGLLLARELFKRGAQPVLLARNSEELERAKADLAQISVREVPVIVCDLRDESRITQVVSEIRQELGDIDILINNAGIIEVGPVIEMEMEDFQSAQWMFISGDPCA